MFALRKTETKSHMNNLLYIIALVLLILWIGGFLFLDLGNLIHILLAVALVLLIIQVVRGNVFKQKL